ncbi:MAG: hypothetical protein EA351_02555 [Gemmatimonadales bacterium]|nr:MAG: hypothetical protein EA351_02555 [Gemmatimonadales bacterium]
MSHRITAGTTRNRSIVLNTLIVLCFPAIAAVGCADDHTPTSPESLTAIDAHSPRGHMHGANQGVEVGTTAGWFQGEVVTFIYNQPFDCPLPLEDGGMAGSDSNCVLGSATADAPRGGDDPVVYVTVPLFEDTEGITLHCPVAGDCINHPSTIDLSRVFGAGTENALLPPHSHVVDVKRGGWWEIEVNGVTTREAWDAIERERSLDEIRVQQALGTVTPDLDTNLFLFFNVMPRNENRGGPFNR